jgi:hypothetical protein
MLQYTVTAVMMMNVCESWELLALVHSIFIVASFSLSFKSDHKDVFKLHLLAYFPNMKVGLSNHQPVCVCVSR